jgi:hypothetical protein
MPHPSPSTGTAHRPTREDRKSREQQQLRRENQHLTREVARLKKYLGKATAVREGFESEPEPEREDSQPVSNGVQCPKCSTEESPPMRAIPIPIGTLHVCEDCQHRFVQRA